MNFLKKSALVSVVISIALTSAFVYARITHTLLVFDMKNEVVLPENFRTTADILPASSNLDTTGLLDLHAAGSQQFSRGGLKAALQHIPSTSIIVVDLRRESHGMVNGHAISWFGPQNAANENKTIPQIKDSEARLLTRLRKSHYCWVYDIIEKTPEDFIEKANREFVPVKQVESEEQVTANEHLGYKRFYVEDFHRPTDQEADRFVTFAKNIPENTWLYFHCRAGKGRTTTFMSMYDMMKNAKHVSLDAILKRQAELGGAMLNELPAESDFKYPYAAERLAFLVDFYEYAKNNTDHFSTSYLQWKRNKSLKSN